MHYVLVVCDGVLKSDNMVLFCIVGDSLNCAPMTYTPNYYFLSLRIVSFCFAGLDHGTEWWCYYSCEVA